MSCPQKLNGPLQLSHLDWDHSFRVHIYFYRAKPSMCLEVNTYLLGYRDGQGTSDRQNWMKVGVVEFQARMELWAEQPSKMQALCGI